MRCQIVYFVDGRFFSLFFGEHLSHVPIVCLGKTTTTTKEQNKPNDSRQLTFGNFQRLRTELRQRFNIRWHQFSDS